MAKITARGCTELARLKATSPAGNAVLFVLRSDGAVLSRFTGDLGTGYNIVAKFRHNPQLPAIAATVLSNYATNRGYKV